MSLNLLYPKQRLALIGCLVALPSLAGCGLGAGQPQRGQVELSITKDFGSQQLKKTKALKIRTSDTVQRILARSAKIKTAYGGRFINEIDGLRSAYTGSRSREEDWFFYVNGVESGRGASEVRVYGGDKIWWDYHSWSYSKQIPAVVGQYPQPFKNGSEGKRFAVRIDCGSRSESACLKVERQLAKSEIAVGRAQVGGTLIKGAYRIVVGTWDEIKLDPAAQLIAQGPKRSGVYLKVTGADVSQFELLSASGKSVTKVADGGGLVAATRVGEAEPTWLITGTDRSGLVRAVAALKPGILRNSFALAVTKSAKIPLPVSRRDRQ